MDFLTGGLPARHGFFTRNGGVSTGAYTSLNCSFSGADEVANIRENRARVARTLDVAPDSLLGLKQVHGTEVITVTTPWAIGAGPAADALVTNRPGLALGVITADCAPVLFADATGRIIGAAHAGWRGAFLGVLEVTVEAMRALGAEGIHAAIGPCIHQKSYEVSADLRTPLIEDDAAAARFFTPGRLERWQFDLPGYCAARLKAAGVATDILPNDTCAEEENFFSYRRKTLRHEAATGHQISVIRT
ncbi:laccase domain protein [Acidocella aquatica]|uniref:Purine nucleoside phosphorylase n=1 Tax=Acidocella aquatica TaxID=1922313 RepID=A0ABQ6A1L9_9PROT|nr:peptidoglycan editing factor PgeF [Acidocella aquatica]GLR65537.1 laccase domain protein [Acidocella aquatica]